MSVFEGSGMKRRGTTDRESGDLGCVGSRERHLRFSLVGIENGWEVLSARRLCCLVSHVSWWKEYVMRGAVEWFTSWS